MPDLNLLAELLTVQAELDEAQLKIDHFRESPIGKLPFVRSRLDHNQALLTSHRMRIEAGINYLNARTK